MCVFMCVCECVCVFPYTVCVCMCVCVYVCVCVSPAYYYGKKKRVCRACVGENSPESEMTKPARRRKKRKSIFVQKKRRSSTVDYTPAGSPQVTNTHTHTHTHPPPHQTHAHSQTILTHNNMHETYKIHRNIDPINRPTPPFT